MAVDANEASGYSHETAGYAAPTDDISPSPYSNAGGAQSDGVAGMVASPWPVEGNAIGNEAVTPETRAREFPPFKTARPDSFLHTGGA